jgi:chromosome segregation ATPase
MGEKEDSWGEWSKHVLIELERLNGKIDGINNRLSKIDRIKDNLYEVKEWKQKMQDTISTSELNDLKEWKQKMEEHQSPTQLEKHLEEHESLKTFKTQAMMIFAVVQALMGIIVFWKEIFN